MKNFYLQDLTGQKYTDVKLTITDGSNEIIKSFHRLILASRFPFFDKLFTFGDGASKTEFTINVVDANIAYDLLMSVYGSIDVSSNCPEWMHLLKTIQLKNYFGLETNPKVLYQLKVPADGYELFLEVIDLFDYTNDPKLMRLIKKNRPANYGLENFTPEFAKELEKKDPLIVSASADHTIKVWDINSGECIQTLYGHTTCVNSVAIINDHIVSTSDDRTIKVWDIESGECIETLNRHAEPIYSIAIMADQRHMVFGHDSTISISDIESAECIFTLNEHTNWICSVAIMADQKHVVSADTDNTIKLWNIDSGLCIQTLNGHTGPVYSVAIMADQKHVVSAGADCTINIWDIESGQCIQTLEGHNHSVLSVAIKN